MSDGITFIVVLFFYTQNYKLKISFYIEINQKHLIMIIRAVFTGGNSML